jgi:hypothetical protein
MPDADTAGNNAILQKLHAPFSATIQGGQGDNDGYVLWDRPCEVVHAMGAGLHLTARFETGAFPLEVGHTEPETTLSHLAGDGGVARWPYGSTHITLLRATIQLSDRPYPKPLPTIVDGAVRISAPAPGEGPRRGGG